MKTITVEILTEVESGALRPTRDLAKLPLVSSEFIHVQTAVKDHVERVFKETGVRVKVIGATLVVKTEEELNPAQIMRETETPFPYLHAKKGGAA